MPIKDKSKYPKNWGEISKRIRQRAGNKCEFCGIQNHIEIIRSDIDADYYITYDPETGGYRYMDGSRMKLSEIPEEYSGKQIRVVLTVAHLNHDTTDNADSNLALLCQLHHNRHDGKMRAQHAKETRRGKRIAEIAEHDRQVGQLGLFEVMS